MSGNTSFLSVNNIEVIYDHVILVLKGVSLEVPEEGIVALLGANGAGKTTLIGTICGMVQPSSGKILVDGVDAWKNYREARSKLALVPQEIALDPFSTVYQTVRFARGYFGKRSNPEFFEKTLKDLSLWDKKDRKVLTLSGGMKRRMSIAKALMNEPKLLFLDEPTAGVDVELRKSMWEMVHELRKNGMTIVLTTHYLEEAERHADRIAFISGGSIKMIEDKEKLMNRFDGMNLEEIFFKLFDESE